MDSIVFLRAAAQRGDSDWKKNHYNIPIELEFSNIVLCKNKEISHKRECCYAEYQHGCSTRPQDC